MNCKDFDLYGSAYIDDMLSNEEKLDFESHIHGCEHCSIKLHNLRVMVESINEIEEVELPIGFSSQLRANLEQEEEKIHKSRVSKRRKIVGGIVASMLIFATSLPLINNSFIQKDSMEFSSMEESNLENKERTTLDIASQKSAQELEIQESEGAEEFKIESASEPRTMSLDNVDEGDEKQKESTQALNRASEIQADENVQKGKNYRLMVSIPIIAAGAIMLIYKLIKK